MQTSTNEIVLAGCTPTPLANYLKALGVLRILTESDEGDPLVRGRWQGECFILHTRLNEDDLKRFFLEAYAPTPILAPWNGGSGFYPGDNQDGIRPLSDAEARRFQAIRQAIHEAREILDGMRLTDKPDKEAKQRLLTLLRSRADERFLAWMDAAVVLTDGTPGYPPLLGTGGNDGRLDFTNNFMQRLVELFDPQSGEPCGIAAAWLEHSLWATVTPGLEKSAIGQFAPGQAGGANATSGFSSAPRVNAWDFILMLEGALLFAAATTRRLESSQTAGLSYPFTVHANHGGSGVAAMADVQSASRGEIWLPLWQQPASLHEIAALFSEGRATVGRRVAQDGLDFACAIGQLGTDRGIAAFQRYGFMVRNGLAYLATPLDRVHTCRAPSADLIADLNQGQFLDRLRQMARDKNAPASLKRVIAQLENALFALTRPGVGQAGIQRAIIHLGEVMQVLGVSRKGQEAVPVPPQLSTAWVLQAADDSAEFRVALALAGLVNLRPYIAPVERDDKGRWQWAPDSRRHIWGKGDLVRNLVRLIERRMIEARRDAEPEPFQSHASLGAGLSDIEGFLRGRTDDGMIAGLLLGLTWAVLPDALPPAREEVASAAIPIAYAVCKPFFTAPALLKAIDRLPADARFNLPGELPRLLAANQTQRALTLAWRRAHIAGLGWPRGDPPQCPSFDGARLLAALVVPLRPDALRKLLPRAEDLQSEPV